MGWFLGCFKCTGDPQHAKLKKQSSGAVNLVSGRVSSAAVAHATSPKDLHRVRKSPSNLAVANSNTDIESESLDSLSSSLISFLPRGKKTEGANLGSKSNDANKFNRERRHNRKLEDELENFRERVVQQADAERQLVDEVKDGRTCHSVLESTPNAFKVTFNKPERDMSRQTNLAQHSWLVSSLVTRSGLLFEASSIPSSPFLGLHEHGSFQSSRGCQASQNVNFYDNPGRSNVLKCAELNVESGVSDECINGINDSSQPTYCKVELKMEAAPSRHEVQSPPWTFSEVKLDITNHDRPYIFESSDDLLCEHLDDSSLIEDSVLITNWERSSGESHLEKWCMHGRSMHSFQVQSQEKEGESLGQKKQKHVENGENGNSLDFNSGCSMVIFEAPSDDETGLFAGSSVGEGCCSPNGMPSEAQVPLDTSCEKEFIYADSNDNSDTKARLLQEECCIDIEESDNESSSKSCFSSQFRLSKCLWSSTKNLFERGSSIAGYLHDNDSDTDEMHLPCTHPGMQPLQGSKNSENENHPLLIASTESSEACIDIRGNYNKCSSVHVDDHILSSTVSSMKALVQQDSVEVFAFEDETVAMREGDSDVVSFPTDEESGEQRKKLRLGHSSSFERVQESMMMVEDEQVRLLNTAAFGDRHENSVEAKADIFNGLESSALEQLIDECAFQRTSDTSFASPSSSYVQMSVASYRSPADDRPILGTVAAHWSPITTKKWWDGKGIPNSTNKYKEDQKVNWHAISFEERLEQALARQDNVLSK